MNRFASLKLALMIGLTSVIALQAQQKGETPPVNHAIAANNDLAFDLYGQLARGEARGKNIFFSPYSISTAMAIVTEGAREVTAEEMGKVLRYPAAVRGKGKEQPWNLEPIHEGIVVLSKRLESANKPAPKALTEKLESLRGELTAANKAIRERGDTKSVATAKKLAEEINKLQGQLNPYEVRVANSLWAEQTYPFKRPYFTMIDKHYGPTLFPVDFIRDYEANRKKINGWVEDHTREKIKDLIPPKAIDKYTRLVVANAIYFKGDWLEPFKQADTKDRPFSTAEGKKADVATLHAIKKRAKYAAFQKDGKFFNTPATIEFGRKKEDIKGLYPDADGFEMVELPYQGGELSMVVIAPRSATGLPALEKLLTAETLTNCTSKLKQRDVDVSMPKFKLEQPFDVKKAFEALGMKRAFTDPRESTGAQFDGMSEASDPQNKLYITKVLHKAFVEVNEKGTEAAAATAVIMAVPTSAPATRPFTPEFKADKPFMFLIRDQKTGGVLFLGRVVNPK